MRNRMVLVPTGLLITVVAAGLLASCNMPSLPFVPALPTPVGRFTQVIGLGGQPLVTTQQVGSIPPGTPVRVSHAYYQFPAWIYVVTADEITFEDAREGQLALAPGVTPGYVPTGVFDAFNGMGGYPLVTTEPVGNIPAGARVRISHSTPTALGVIYTIVATDEVTIADATEDQLALALDVTPGPTPTMQFSDVVGMPGYNLVTTQQAGSIPAGTRVRVSHATFDLQGWVYVITADEITYEEATADQLELAPGVTPGPTPTY